MDTVHMMFDDMEVDELLFAQGRHVVVAMDKAQLRGPVVENAKHEANWH